MKAWKVTWRADSWYCQIYWLCKCYIWSRPWQLLISRSSSFCITTHFILFNSKEDSTKQEIRMLCDTEIGITSSPAPARSTTSELQDHVSSIMFLELCFLWNWSQVCKLWLASRLPRILEVPDQLREDTVWWEAQGSSPIYFILQ